MLDDKENNKDLTLEEQREADIMKMAGIETRLKVAFWGWYLNPTSPTLMNAYQSALRAGFPEEQAASVTQYKWFKRSQLKDEIFSTAEDVLGEMLKLSTITTKILKDGTEVTTQDPALIKIKQDTAKFIASTLGKKDYSQRSELSGKNGGPIETKKSAISDEEVENILNAYVSKRANKRGEDSSPEESI